MLNLSNIIRVTIYNVTQLVCYSDHLPYPETLSASFYVPIPSTPYYTVADADAGAVPGGVPKRAHGTALLTSLALDPTP